MTHQPLASVFFVVISMLCAASSPAAAQAGADGEGGDAPQGGGAPAGGAEVDPVNDAAGQGGDPSSGEVDGVVDPVEPGAEGEESPTEAEAAAGRARDEALGKVDRARKLARVQEWDEAIALLKAAYLTLDDPELLRMLGELHAARGDAARSDAEAAVRFFDDYLQDPDVGEMSKAPVRERRDALAEEIGQASAKVVEGESGFFDFDDWEFESGGALAGRPGHLYLTAGARISYNEGAEFSARRGGGGPEPDARVEDQWIHGGVGGEVEVGGFMSERMSLGLAVGLDGMSWKSRAAQEEFETESISGLRPSLYGNLRLHIGWGLHVGASMGGDLMVVTQSSDPICDPATGVCPDFKVDAGIEGFRFVYGGLLGYRAELSEAWSAGVDVAVRFLPVFGTFEGSSVGVLPAYLEDSWMLNVAVVLNWNL